MRKLFVTVLMLFPLSFAHADTCSASPTTAIISHDGNIAVRIDPGSPAESGMTRIDCVATLTKWNAKEQTYGFLRRITLRNEVRPDTAVITNDARFLITFDDYCEMGMSANAVVIYDLEKGTSYAHALSDFLPASFRETLQNSISSIYWRDEPSVDERTHIVYLVSGDAKDRYPSTIHIDAEKNAITFKEGGKRER
jgi:hypothetical protein